MKKLLVFTAAVFMVAVSINAQDPLVVKNDIKKDKMMEKTAKKEIKEEKKELRKLNGTEVSYQSKQAFVTDFGNLPVSKWTRSSNFDEASFTKDGQAMTAYYDADSKLVGTISHVKFANLPAAAQKYINNKYRGWTRKEIFYFEDNAINETDMVFFGTQFSDADNYFVDLKKGNKEVILQSDMDGRIKFFRQIK